jgi:PleD family two-component response regulator
VVAGWLSGAVDALNEASRTISDRRMQRAVIELAAAGAALDKNPDAAAAERLVARAKIVAQTLEIQGVVDIRAVVVDLIEIASGNRPPVAQASTPLASPRPRTANTVLVISEDKQEGDGLVIRLRISGLTAEYIAIDNQVLRKIVEIKPALILCDMDGTLIAGELLVLAIRTNPATEIFPFVAVTGDADRLGPEHRVDTVLIKPYSSASLQETVRRALDASKTPDLA